MSVISLSFRDVYGHWVAKISPISVSFLNKQTQFHFH